MTWDYYELKKAFGKGKCEVKKCDAHSCRSNTKQDIRGQNASQGYCRLDVITIDSKGKCEQFKPSNQGGGKGRRQRTVARDIRGRKDYKLAGLRMNR